MRRLVLLALAATSLAACSSTDKDTAITGERVSVLKAEQQLKVDPQLADFQIDVPVDYANSGWPQSMGVPDGSLGNVSFTREPERAWSHSIGEGSDDDQRIVSRPVVAAHKVFAIDSEAFVSAYNVEDGERVWSTDLTPEEYDEPQFGGGVAYSEGRLYVTTGYGSIAALNAETGEVVWQRDIKARVRGAPTVSGTRVFVVTADGQTFAYNAADGVDLWTHTAISEISTLLGTASPVVADDVAYVPYNSGELYAIRVQNGRSLWQQSLAGTRRGGGALPVMSDIKGSPAIDNERVYAISNGGRMVGIDKRTGNPAWDIDMAGVDTPVLLGSTLAVLANQNMLVLLDAKSGRVHKIYDLPRFEDEEDSKHPIYWTGPVIAQGVMWVAGSNEQLRGVDIQTGETVFEDDLPGVAYLAPVVAEKTLFVLTDDGELVAYR